MIQLGWVCVPLAVETYGNWGSKAHTIITRLATQLAICASVPKRRSLMTFMGDLDWCCQGAWQELFWQESCPNLLNR